MLDPFIGEKVFNRKSVDLEIHDTISELEFSDDRKMIYRKADVFMICVPANRPSALEDIESWCEEVSAVEPDALIFLILTKSDVDGSVTIETLQEQK